MEDPEGANEHREQFQEFVDDWARLATGFVTSSSDLAKRMIRQQPGQSDPGERGPLQELWMAMASAAGDMAELSYRWVQAVDGLAGFSTAGGAGAGAAAGERPAGPEDAAPDPSDFRPGPKKAPRAPKAP